MRPTKVARAAPAFDMNVIAWSTNMTAERATAAGATATTGPDLGKLPTYAKTAGKPLADFIRQSIVDPNAYVEKGYPKSVMPQTFGKALSKQELDSLVQYLISSSKKG